MSPVVQFEGVTVKGLGFGVLKLGGMVLGVLGQWLGFRVLDFGFGV